MLAALPHPTTKNCLHRHWQRSWVERAGGTNRLWLRTTTFNRLPDGRLSHPQLLSNTNNPAENILSHGRLYMCEHFWKIPVREIFSESTLTFKILMSVAKMLSKIDVFLHGASCQHRLLQVFWKNGNDVLLFKSSFLLTSGLTIFMFIGYCLFMSLAYFSLVCTLLRNLRNFIFCYRYCKKYSLNHLYS